jgi:hypothetical protein
MRNIWSVLGRVVKVLAVAAIGSLIRISNGQGEGALEKAFQEAFANFAESYVRKVKQ